MSIKKEQMRILHYREDLRTIVFITATLLLTSLQWLGIVRHPLLYTASCLLAFIACVINHNHQHHPTFVAKRLNLFFSWCITLAIGQPASAIIPMHNKNHHVYNNRDGDFVRVDIVSFRWNVCNLLAFPFVAIAGYFRAKKSVLRSWKRRQPTLYKRFLYEKMVFYSFIIPLLLYNPTATITYVVAPWLIGQWGIIAINHVQHYGCNPDSHYNHSINFTGRWLNWWVFNNGYHTVHHLWPAMHWSLLPRKHDEIRDHIDPRLRRKSLLWTLVKTYLVNTSRTFNNKPSALKGFHKSDMSSDMP